MKRIMVMGALVTSLMAAVAAAAESPAESGSAQALYLQAGKLERQGQQARAVELYERLIDAFPNSEFAVKANDRLLGVLKQPAATQPASAPVTAPVADPKARARELLTLHKKALDIADRERRRLSYAFTNFYAHRVDRGELREKEDEWDRAAEQKVRADLGMGGAQIREMLDAACRELGIAPPCDEKSLK